MTDNLDVTDEPDGRIRLGVDITADTGEGIQYAADITGNTRTDVVNRAIGLYAHIARQNFFGKAVIVANVVGDTVVMFVLPLERLPWMNPEAGS